MAKDAEGNDVVETTEIPQVLNVISDALEGLVGQDELDSIEKDARNLGIVGKATAPAAAKPVAAAKPSAEGGEGASAAEAAPAEGAEGAKPNAFGIGSKKGTAAANNTGVVIPTKIASFEELATITKSKFGQEVKDLADMPKFLASAEKWRSDSSKLPEATKKAKDLENILENAPVELVDGLKLHYSGGNWREAVDNKPAFDLSKDVEKQDIKALVNHYYKGKFTEDDFKEGETPSPALEIAIDASKAKFVAEKSAFDTKRAKQYTDAQAGITARTSSIAGSVAHLKTSFPDVTEQVETEVQAFLTSGDVRSLFFNDDGTYKPEAAEAYMLIKYGKETMVMLSEQAELAGESKANEDILTRGADTTKPVKGGAGKPNEEVVKKIEELTGGMTKKSFY